MSEPTPPAHRAQTLLVCAWLLGLALWTAALLTSFPAEASHELLPPEAGWSLSKLLHVAAYAFLTALLGRLRLPRVRCWALLVGLSLHACATEWLQQYVPLRSGSVQDVLIDHAGILVGGALSLKAWSWRT